MNLATILDMAAEAHGERTAIVAGAQRLGCTQLREQAQAVAEILRARKLTCLALLDTNSPVAAIALFGAAYAGIPYVPLNYRLNREEIKALIARLSPALVIAGSNYLPLIDKADGIEALSRDEFLRAIRACAAPPREAGDDGHAIAVQLFTSGTTGQPKAAILRHENLMAYILGTVEFASAAEDEATLISVPPYHIAGISAILSSTYAGRRMVQLENFDAGEWVATARREAVSHAFVVPTMLSRIVEHLRRENDASLPALRALAYGGGRMPATTISEAMRLLPQVEFTNAYGLTETSSTIAVLGPEEHRAALASDDPRQRRRLSSVGKATAAVEIEVRDESGRVLGANETGLLFVRGAQVAGEYQQQGSQLDEAGWFATRDRGFVDDEGYLFLDGRDDDVIVRGGENISPGEIEDVLLSHPAVSDAAVVAVPDEQWGEGVAAAVVVREGASADVAELQALVRARLRSSRVPQTIEFRLQLPYNELGKLLRRSLRQEMAARLAAASARAAH